MNKTEKRTPMMQQWHDCKQSAKNALLLFRMGDFYEAFYEDANILADELDLTLTKRQDVPMAGIPWHVSESYIEKLINKGFKVAIAEQVENAKESQGIMERKIVRFVTPGTTNNPQESSNNFIVSVTQVGSIFGLACLDITTSLFQVVEFEDIREMACEIHRLSPSEIVTTESFREKHHEILSGWLVSLATNWQFEHKIAYNYLTEHFHIPHLDCFGLKGMVAAINAAGGLLYYIHEDLAIPISHILGITLYSTSNTLSIDRTTQRNLELTEPVFESSKKNTLMAILDHTETPMGKRLLKQWIKRPLLDLEKINERLDRVESFYYAVQMVAKLRKQLNLVRDLERLIMKVSSKYATPRDLLALGISLGQISEIIETLNILAPKNLVSMDPLASSIKQALVDEPPAKIFDGAIFRTGYNKELDELYELQHGGKTWLAQYQNQIKEETGVKNLKVSFNKIFGYYIEVSKGQAHLMPPSFHRRQTLVNSERFVSPILQEYETKVFSAQERIQHLEQELFQNLCNHVTEHTKTILTNAQEIAQIDVYASLASLAKEENYCRPIVDNSLTLNIKSGKHPVIAKMTGETFIANDAQLDDYERVMLITGPNMAGKSTYIRQVALIVVLAQMGSFVPCIHAHVGIVDKIFSRIGANDDLSRGQSTFMVEMSETAHILNNVSKRSLVILDEIGRGTSTYDGIAIARAVAEFLHESGAKVLFATHYWELTELENLLPGVVNYHATVTEEQNCITFRHRIERGGADKSYGIYVAKLAGIPNSVIGRAKTILKQLEAKKEIKKRAQQKTSEEQLTLF